MYAEVLKIAKKSILVGVKGSKYSLGWDQIGYCSNPDGLKKGQEVLDFNPKGVVNKNNDKGEVMCTKNGEPLSFWQF